MRNEPKFEVSFQEIIPSTARFLMYKVDYLRNLA